MSVLIDTNLLTRSVQPGSPQFQSAVTALRELPVRGERLCVVPQVLYEYWAVATRPANVNGLGLTTTEARDEQLRVLSLAAFLADTPDVFLEWQRLVVAHDVKGKNAHDARLVAAMNVHGLTRLLTFNGVDFARYPGIVIVDPQTVVPGATP
jgi:predicted nucleic acid-binding protein